MFSERNARWRNATISLDHIQWQFLLEVPGVTGLFFFMMMFLAGEYLSSSFHLPIPGSIIGLGMALCVMALRGRVDAPLKSSASTLLRFLPLMMVPLGVGVVKLTDAPPSGLWRLIVVLLASLAIGSVGAAFIMQGFLGLRKAGPELAADTRD